MAEQRLSEPEQMRRRAQRLAVGLAEAGHDRASIEQRLGAWHFHPAVAFQAAADASYAPPSFRTGGPAVHADSAPEDQPED